jgi:hypothetical protein
METLRHVIDPEIPQTPEEKLALLQLCIDALRNGARVEGVTPRHVSQEGMYMINHANQENSGL